MSFSVRHFAAPFAHAGIRAWRQVTGPRRGLNVLLFHDIPARHRQAFAACLDYVERTHGFVSPQEAEAWLRDGNGQPAPGDRPAPCLLTFDDGFRSNFEVAHEILEPRGVKAAFFVCPGLVDLDAEDQRAAISTNILTGGVTAATLPPETTLMNWQDINDLIGMGHRVGCHGMGHRRLTTLAGADLEHEIAAAADLLDTRTATSTPWYAFAFGDIASINPAALKIIRQRFPFCRSGIRGMNTATTAPGGLYAESIDPASPIAYQKLVVEGGLDFRYRAARQALATMLHAADTAP